MFYFLLSYSIIMAGIAFVTVQYLPENRSSIWGTFTYFVYFLVLMAFWLKFACDFGVWVLDKRKLSMRY